MRLSIRNLAGLCLLVFVFAVNSYAADLNFPPDAGILNVTTFGALPNDGVDDTAAIQAAVEFAANNFNRYGAAPFIYLPIGVYNVSAPIESRIADRSLWFGWRSGMHLVGQSRTGTILRLSDNNPAYQSKTAPQAVIRTGSEQDGAGTPQREDGTGNQAFRQYIENLTIELGRGNPGAVGIDYLTSNLGAVQDVTIRSTDPAKVCLAGIAMLRSPGPGIIKNVLVDGCDVGIEISPSLYSMVLEHVIVNNQAVAGVRNTNNVLSIRDLRSTQTTAPGIINTSATYVISSTFTGAAGAPSAIVNSSVLFVRDTSFQGYVTAIKQNAGGTASLPGGDALKRITEFVSGSPEYVFDSPPRSQRLTIRETPTPVPFAADFSNAVSVTAFGATPRQDTLGTDDDGPAIQAAIDSGAEIVYLPNGIYNVGSPVIVRGAVRRIVGFAASVFPLAGTTLNPIVIFEGGAAGPTHIEQLRFNGVVENRATTPLVLQRVETNGGYRSLPTATGDLYLEDVIIAMDVNSPQKIWARQLDLEGIPAGTPTGVDAPPLFRNNGGTVWVLGLKTESEFSVVHNLAGSVEVIGGLVYPIRGVIDRVPVFKNLARLSAGFAMTGNNYRQLAIESKLGTSRDLLREEWNGRALPLYVGYPGVSLLAAYTFDRESSFSVDENTASTSSVLVQGAGLAGTPAPEIFRQRISIDERLLTTTLAGAQAADDTLSFTVTPAAGRALNVSSLAIDAAQISPFTDRIRIGTSLDNFTTTLDFPLRKTFSTVTFDLSTNAAYQGVTVPLTFKLYLFGSGAGPQQACTTCRIVVDSVSVYGITQ